ncbi:MAG: DUF4190 domain-containing protein, partial [Acidobacteriota bacterium]
GLSVKRCPKCNQTFDEEWLSFCTQDGTTLIDDAPLPSDPQPTIPAPNPPAATSPNEQVTWNLSSGSDPGGQISESPAAKPVWQPPPPPLYAQPANKSLATAAMVLGIISVTVGWMCFGPIPGIAAIILGGVALSQIKKNPERVTGRQFAWVGVITGSLTLVIYACVMIFYVIIAIMSANH